VVERYVGRETLLNEALDFIVPEATSKAIEQESLESVSQPRVEILKLDPVTIKATVPLEPVVELGSYREIRVNTEVPTVGEVEVDVALEQIRLDMAPWEPVERAVRYGDLATMDLRLEADGRTLLDVQGQAFVPRDRRPDPVRGFSEALEGAAKDETREFVLPFPEDYSDRSLQGKEGRFTVAVREVKEKRLPPLDDDFAKGVGQGYESLQALRAKLLADLQSEAARIAKQQREEQVVEALLQGTQFEIPPLLVEHEVDHLLSDEEESLRRQRVTLEAYLGNVGKTLEQRREELRESALLQLRRSLALLKVAKTEGIEVTEEEVGQEIDNLAGASQDHGAEIRRIFDTQGGRASVQRTLWVRRTVERLVSLAKGEAPQEEPGGASSEVLPSVGAAVAAGGEKEQTEGGKSDAV